MRRLYTPSRPAPRATVAALAALVALPFPRASAAPATAPAPEPVAPTTTQSGEPSPFSPKAVGDAADKARDFLLDRLKDGNAEAAPAPVAGEAGFKGRRWGEVTALTVYAILASGQPVDQRWLDAFAWLNDVATDDPGVLVWRDTTLDLYGVDRGLKRPRKRLGESDVHVLNWSMCRSGPATGFFTAPLGPEAATRPTRPPTAPADLDASQAAVRAFHALSGDMGLEVDDRAWAMMEAGWRAAAQPDGSWPAPPDGGPAARFMTTANAVATLILLRDRTLPFSRNWSDCSRGVPTDPALEAGLAWLERHAGDAFGSPPDPRALYALGRVGLLTGRRTIGGIDWYARGAGLLLKAQKADGSWPPAPGLTGADPAGRLIPETAYAMMFLAEGLRAPVITRLEYAPPDVPAGTEFQRPHDVRHFTAWSSRELQTYGVGWQQAGPSTPLEDLLAAPVLYVAGSKPLAPTPAQEQVLHDYVLHGGLILGSADCGSREFVDSFVSLGRRLFPFYGFRALPADHPIFSQEIFRAKRWHNPPELLGLSNGVRELMLLVPQADLSRAWEVDNRKAGRDRFELGFDVLCYATERRLATPRFRGEPPPAAPLRPDPGAKADRTIRVALLSYAGNWEPEPGGWRRLANLMHDQSRTDLDLTPVNPGEGRLDPKWFQAALLTGTAAVALSPAAQKELSDFADGGGTLIVDAAGGSAAFADSIEPVLAAAFGGSADDLGMVLPQDHAVYTPAGNRIEQFRYRRFCAERMPGSPKLPRVRGIEKGGRIRVFYSRQDLTAGLVGSATDGIIGYEPETATAVMRNLLLYAADKPQAPRP